MTSTQVNANADDNSNIRNEASLAGGRSTINKADNGCIMARPTKDELEILTEVTKNLGLIPNIVTDIYKVRSGEYNQVRIWSYVDLGNLRKKDLFITDSRLQILEQFNNNYKLICEWGDDEEYRKISEDIRKLNND